MIDDEHNAEKTGVYTNHTAHYWVGHKSGKYMKCGINKCTAIKDTNTGKITYEKKD